MHRGPTLPPPARIGVLAVALALVVAGCSGGGSGGKGATATSAGADTTTTAPGPDLATLMPRTVPSGYALQPDDVANTGPSDLAKAVSDDTGPDARSVLTHAGFLRGYQRLWLAPDQQDQNILYLYQFRDANGAGEYLVHLRATLSDAGGGTPPEPFDVPGIPGATGASASDSTGSAAVIVFARGVYVVQAVANGKPGSDQRLMAIALAQAQYARL